MADLATAAVVLCTVVGRLSLEELCILTDQGWRVTLRVPTVIGSQLGLGQRAELVLGPDGWPVSLRLIAG